MRARESMTLDNTRPTQRVARLTVLLVAVVLSVAGCGRGGGPQGAAARGPVWSPVPTTARLYYDNSGGIRDSLRIVVRDDATLRAVWSQATSSQSSPPPPPAIDFARDMLILVAAGRKTAEEQIRVDSVTIQRVASDGGREAMFAIVRLDEGCQRFNIDAYPLEIVRVTRFDGPVEFVERRQRPQDCPPGG